MSGENDLQLQMTARLGNVGAAADQVEGKLKAVEGAAKKLNTTTRDFQAHAGAGFGGAGVAANKFTGETTVGFKRLTDRQAEANEGLLKIHERFRLMHGVALNFGAAGVAALVGIVEATRLVSEAMEHARKAAAEASKEFGTKVTASAITIAGIEGVDAQQITNVATAAEGTATQDQINEFVGKLAQKNAENRKVRVGGANGKGGDVVELPESALPLDNIKAAGAIRTFAKFGAIKGADELILQDLEETGNTSRAEALLGGQLDRAAAVDPNGIRLLRGKRHAETLSNIAGQSASARSHELAEDIHKSDQALIATRILDDPSQLRRGVNTTLDTVFDFLSNHIPGFKTRHEEKAEGVIGGRQQPVQVHVINQPRPLDAGY